jgi:hypothetical protein
LDDSLSRSVSIATLKHCCIHELYSYRAYLQILPVRKILSQRPAYFIILVKIFGTNRLIGVVLPMNILVMRNFP